MDIRHHSKKGILVSEFLKKHVEKRLQKIEGRHFNVSKVDVTSIKEGNFYTIELYIRGQKEVRSSATTHNFVESFDRSLQKAIVQINKLRLCTRERRRDQKKSKRIALSKNLGVARAGGKKAA